MPTQFYTLPLLKLRILRYSKRTRREKRKAFFSRTHDGSSDSCLGFNDYYAVNIPAIHLCVAWPMTMKRVMFRGPPTRE